MLEAAISETTAPCPKCRKDMVLAVVIPHPVAHQLAKHTYLCVNCNQTKTYILPVASTADCVDADLDPRTTPRHGEPDSRRREPREALRRNVESHSTALNQALRLSAATASVCR